MKDKMVDLDVTARTERTAFSLYTYRGTYSYIAVRYITRGVRAVNIYNANGTEHTPKVIQACIIFCILFYKNDMIYGTRSTMNDISVT